MSSALLKSGDTIVVIEERKVNATVTEANRVTVKISQNLTADLSELFNIHARPNEGFLQFINRMSIGRVIVPKETFVTNINTNKLIIEE